MDENVGCARGRDDLLTCRGEAEDVRRMSMLDRVGLQELTRLHCQYWLVSRCIHSLTMMNTDGVAMYKILENDDVKVVPTRGHMNVQTQRHGTFWHDTTGHVQAVLKTILIIYNACCEALPRPINVPGRAWCHPSSIVIMLPYRQGRWLSGC